jgi:hypothetical protein
MENSCKWYDPSCGIDYLIDQIQYVFLMMFESILSGLASVLELIPVPDFVSQIPTMQLPEYFLYIADIFQLYAGIQIVMSCYLIRFLIRRLPFIG